MLSGSTICLSGANLGREIAGIESSTFFEELSNPREDGLRILCAGMLYNVILHLGPSLARWRRRPGS
jgi:hypothetical protein